MDEKGREQRGFQENPHSKIVVEYVENKINVERTITTLTRNKAWT